MQESPEAITAEQLERTFRTNIFAQFFIVKAALPHLKDGSAIVNIASVTAFANAVAPGPIWTPLIPASYPADRVAEFGSDVPMKRPGQPREVAAAVIFLASNDASYISGQTIHVNGGEVVNS